MEIFLTSTIFGVFIIFAYTLGLRNGQKIVKQEEIKIPNPVRAMKEMKEIKEEQEALDEYQKLLDNINNYGVPGYEQKDVNLNEQ